MTKKCLIVIVLLVFIVNSYAQHSVPKIIPLSPEAASLFKYTERPVSYNTGIPNISIPLFDIKSGAISVPVSLSYHAGGHKVTDIATRVGLGWNLNAGGMVSRVVRDLPDDDQWGFINTLKTIAAFDLYGNCSPESRQILMPLEYFIKNLYFEPDDLDPLDYQPDLFNFNFMGYSGNFIYDQKEGVFVQMPKSLIHIEPIFIMGRIEQWKFTTPDGFNFYFGRSLDGMREAYSKTEGSSTLINLSNIPNASLSQDDTEFINSWHLMDIVDPNGKMIHFEYDEFEGLFDGFAVSDESIILSYYEQGSSGGSFMTQEYQQTAIVDASRIGMHLKSITYSDGKLDFVESTTERKDRPGTYALEKITQFDGNNTPVKSFEFNYDYFEYTGSAQSSNFQLGEIGNFRLSLKEVFQKDQLTGATLPPHKFEYNTNDILPNRSSNAQDYWGYYNGITNNNTLIPKVKLSDNNYHYYKGDANRTVDTLKSQACMLKTIIFPTGGSETFEYESNEVSPSRISSDYHWGNSYNLRNRLNDNYLTFNDLDTDPTNQYLFEKSFTIGSNITGPVSVYLDFLQPDCFDNLNTSNMIVFDIVLSCSPYIIKIIGPNNYERWLLPFEQEEIELLPGNYQVVAEENPNFEDVDPETYFNVILNWGEDLHPDKLFVGGLRVKKMITEDDKGNIITRNFDYTNFNNSESSAYMSDPPILVNDEKISANNLSMTSMTGGHVFGYENVTENYEGYLNGKKEFSYKAFDYYQLHEYIPSYDQVAVMTDYDAGRTNYPTCIDNNVDHNHNLRLPRMGLDWEVGKLIKQTDYAFNNNQFDKVRQTENSYENFGTEIIEKLGKKIISKKYAIVAQSTSTFGMTRLFGNYPGISEWYRIKQTKTTDYFDGNEVVSTQDYIYDNNPGLTSSTVVATNDNKTVVTKTFYPEDVTSTSSLGYNALSTDEKSAIDRLKKTDLHRIAVPVQTETAVKSSSGTVLSNSVQRTNFKDWGNNQMLPREIQTLKGANPLEDRITYHNYDTNGNPLEVSKKDGTHIVYIWGYSQQYPIAKIENATYSQVTGFVSNLQTLSNADDSVTDENDLRTALDAMRNDASLSKAMVTTYTYDPLIGVTSITDPRGQTIYYHYDNFNRLEYVKDAEGNILGKNEYHYKNQQ